MNPFTFQSFSHTKDNQFQNKRCIMYLKASQNRYIPSVDRNNMPRYSYNTVGLSGAQPWSSQPRPAIQIHFYPNRQLFQHVALPIGLCLINQNSPSPSSVLNGKVNSLAMTPHETNAVIEKNYLTKIAQFPLTETEGLVQNLTKSPFEPDINHMGLLNTFNKNFSLLKPGILDVHDQKRKEIAQDEEIVQRSFSQKRKKPTIEALNEPNSCVHNPNSMNKDEGQERPKVMIREDEDGFLVVCYDSLRDNKTNIIEKEKISLMGGSEPVANLVDKSNEEEDLDLTLHL